MSDDVATLRDSVVNEQESAAVAEPKAEAVAEEPKPIRIVEEVSPDAVEIGRILLDAGYSKANVNELLQAPHALNAIRYAVENNPQEFLHTLERTSPKAGGKFLETMADTFLARYGEKESPAKRNESTAPNLEVESLKERLNRMEAERTTERQQAQIAMTRQRYEQRVDDLFTQVKELGLTKAETRNMKARLDVELGRDPGAAQRASSGNFVDVPKVFQSIVDEHVQDKKEILEAEKTRREKAEKGAFPEFQNGPNPFANVKIPAGSDDSWDATENALAAALKAY